MVTQIGFLKFFGMPGLIAGILGRTAVAYLDPGSGSYLLQLLIAGLVGGALLLRAYWGRLGRFLRGRLRRGASPEEDSSSGGAAAASRMDDDTSE